MRVFTNTDAHSQTAGNNGCGPLNLPITIQSYLESNCIGRSQIGIFTMISDDLRFIAVHINRTGGTSRERILKVYGRPLKKRIRRHSTASELQILLGPLWEKYFSFSFVRNPWDRIVSIYHNRRNLLTKHAIYEAPKRKSFKKWLLTEKFNDDVMVGDQTRWLTDSTGTIIVDFIGRFENMDKDWKTICIKIGISKKTTKDLPHVNRSEHKHYSSYYDQETIEAVRTMCQNDIDNFGYSYE